MFDYEELQNKFCNAYCIWKLYIDIEQEIAGLFRSKLPKQVSNNIQTIGIEDDPDGYLQVLFNLKNKEVSLEVYNALKEAFPQYTFEPMDTDPIVQEHNIISLRLDDDVVNGIPYYLL